MTENFPKYSLQNYEPISLIMNLANAPINSFTRNDLWPQRKKLKMFQQIMCSQSSATLLAMSFPSLLPNSWALWRMQLYSQTLKQKLRYNIFWHSGSGCSCWWWRCCKALPCPSGSTPDRPWSTCHSEKVISGCKPSLWKFISP